MKKLFCCKKNILLNDTNEGEVLLIENNKAPYNNRTIFNYPLITIILFLLLIIIIILLAIYPHYKKDSNIENENNIQQKKRRIRIRYSKEEALQRGRIYLDKCLDGLLFNNQTITDFKETRYLL